MHMLYCCVNDRKWSRSFLDWSWATASLAYLQKRIEKFFIISRVTTCKVPLRHVVSLGRLEEIYRPLLYLNLGSLLSQVWANGSSLTTFACLGWLREYKFTAEFWKHCLYRKESFPSKESDMILQSAYFACEVGIINSYSIVWKPLIFRSFIFLLVYCMTFHEKKSVYLQWNLRKFQRSFVSVVISFFPEKRIIVNRCPQIFPVHCVL